MSDPIRVDQKDAEWVSQATRQQITRAMHRGELAVLLGGTAPIDVAGVVASGETVTRDDLDAMTPAQVSAARESKTMTLQRDRAWLSQASQTEIAAATTAGELQTVLAGGDPPSAALQEELERIVDIHPPAPLPGQGANADSASPDGQTWRQREREKLRQMSSIEIVAAQARGDFNELLNVKSERNAQ